MTRYFENIFAVVIVDVFNVVVSVIETIDEFNDDLYAVLLLDHFDQLILLIVPQHNLYNIKL